MATVFNRKPYAVNPNVFGKTQHGTVITRAGRAVLAAAAFAVAVAASATSPLRSDSYQFIVSGYPAANENYAAASSGTALITSTQSDGSAASPIEARYRTWDMSDGTALRSDKYFWTIIILR